MARRSSKAASSILLPGLAAGIYTIAFLSGMASLIHEVAWSRLFILVVGSSADSAAVILVGFMAGFGGGALLAGRLENKITYPLMLLLASQLLVALYGLVIFVLTTGALPQVWAPLFAGKAPAATWLLRITFSTLQVALPAAAMGMSLPLLMKSLAFTRTAGDGKEADTRLRRSGAALIALNTAGACAGTFLAGYVLIPLLSISTTCAAAAMLNIAAAFLAALLLVFHERRAAKEWIKKIGKKPSGPAVADRFHLIEAAAFVAGFFVLAMEILWRRVLVMAFGHDTYGMTAMLLTVIAGLSVGGGFGCLLMRLFPGKARETGGVLLLLTCLAAPAAMALGCAFVIHASPDPFGLIGVPSLTRTLYGGILEQIVISAMIIGLPSILAGSILPVLCGEMKRRAGSVSAPLARLLIANYAGSMSGAAAAAFLLVGRLGIHGSTLFVSLLPALAGGALLLSRGGKRLKIVSAVFLGAVIVTFFFLPTGLGQKLFLRTAGGAYLSSLYYNEGRTSTVGVTKDDIDGERQLLINGVNEVSNRFVHDQSFNLLGHLGLLLHPEPENVLILSFGGGITAGAAAAHNPKTITAVDLERGVIEASQHFRDLNNDILAKKNLDIVIEDGRFFLLTAKGPFDVIIIDSTHPRSIDSWLLYTRQFYTVVKGRLEKETGPGGIVVQWVPLHGMSSEEFKIILSTFLSVFPEGQLWANVGYDSRGFSGYALLVGSPEGKILIDVDRIARKLEAGPEVRRSLSTWLLDSTWEILNCFIAAGPPLREWTAGLPVIDDDRPIIPFVTTWSKAGRVHPSILTEVLQGDGPPLGPAASSEALDVYIENLPMRYLSLGHLLRGDIVGAMEKNPEARTLKRYAEEKEKAAVYYRNLAGTFPDDIKSVLTSVKSLRGLGDTREALAVVSKAVSEHPGNPALLFELALSLEFAGQDKKAIAVYGNVLELQPEAVPAMNNLALLLAGQERHEAALSLLVRSGEIDPEHYPTWIATGRVQTLRKEFALALDAFRRADALSPGAARTQNYMGLSLSSMGKYRAAATLFKKAHAIDPFWEEPCFNAGLAYFSQKKFAAARAWFEKATMCDPNDSAFWHYLGMSLAAQDRWSESIDPYLMALQLDAESDLAWLHLGFAYKNIGAMELARDCFTSALKINPDLANEIEKK